MSTDLRLTVVSPFLDRQHGTELCLIEQLERLAHLPGWSIDLYAQRVEQLTHVRLDSPGALDAHGEIVWHKIPDIPGPHLLKFLWWFAANQWRRRRERRSGRPAPDIVYSPGINCFDADVIAVHIVFHEFYARVRSGLALYSVPPWSWPRVIHRRLYYRLIMFLEQRIYSDKRIRLVAVSARIAAILKARFGRLDVTVIPNAVDLDRFSPEVRRARRAASRQTFHFQEYEFVALLIGNDWKNKGLEALLRAAAQLRELPLRLLVAGQDDPELFRALVGELALQDRVLFAKPSPDVLQFYAAADLYAAPSLEDSFGLPIVEAMACGLPVIASVHAGASELVRDGENGLLLRRPTEASELAGLIRTLLDDAALGASLGAAAAQYVEANCGWDQNAERTRLLLEEALARRTGQK
jgi:UDP-glucose:(heptosyl)LPS alpha-1,3-glucosyltransferase